MSNVIPASLPTKLIPSFPSIVITPADDVKLLSPTESKEIPPVCAFKSTVIPSNLVVFEAELPIVIFLPVELVPILIAPLKFSVPIPMLPLLESNVKEPTDSRSNVEDVIDVELSLVITIVPSESNSITLAFKSIFVEESLPIEIVLADALVPIFIEPIALSTPIFIEPLEESIVKLSVDCKSIIELLDILVAEVELSVVVVVFKLKELALFIKDAEVLPKVIILADALVPIFIAPLLLSVPILILPLDESIETFPNDCKSIVFDEVNEAAPKLSSFNSPPESISISLAFKSIFVEESLPILIDLADVLVPILIVPVFTSEPILISPFDESIDKWLNDWISVVPYELTEKDNAFNDNEFEEVLPIVMVLADALVPIFIAPVSLSSPKFKLPLDEFNDKLPTESILNVDPELISVEVSLLRIILPPESNSTVNAFKSIFVEESLPIFMVLADALLPKLIVPELVSEPILISPLDESNVKFPVDWTSKVVPVVIFVEFILSTFTLIAFELKLVVVLLPIANTLAVALVPIFILPVLSSAPILISPSDESNFKLLVDCTSIPVSDEINWESTCDTPNLLILTIFLLPSKTKALLAAAVPLVISSIFSKSVSSMIAFPIMILLLTVTLLADKLPSTTKSDSVIVNVSRSLFVIVAPNPKVISFPFIFISPEKVVNNSLIFNTPKSLLVISEPFEKYKTEPIDKAPSILVVPLILTVEFKVVVPPTDNVEVDLTVVVNKSLIVKVLSKFKFWAFIVPTLLKSFPFITTSSILTLPKDE